MLDRHVGDVKAVDGVSFSIEKGETVGLVGESGCGKSTLGRAILRLYKPTSGRISFEGQDITNASENDLHACAARCRWSSRIRTRRSIRGIRSAASSASRCGRTSVDVGKGARRHASPGCSTSSGCRADSANRYPHEFSGGQRQRIGLARAIALNPDFVVCDEPVSALDVSIQAQIINLLEDLQRDFDLTYLFIAHDLAVVRHISTRIIVMYLGKIVEIAPADDLYENPLHPYTVTLLSAIPIPDPWSSASAARSASAATCRARRTRRRPAVSTRAARSCSRRAAPTRSRSLRQLGGHLVACHLRRGREGREDQAEAAVLGHCRAFELARIGDIGRTSPSRWCSGRGQRQIRLRSRRRCCSCPHGSGY